MKLVARLIRFIGCTKGVAFNVFGRVEHLAEMSEAKFSTKVEKKRIEIHPLSSVDSTEKCPYNSLVVPTELQ